MERSFKNHFMFDRVARWRLEETRRSVVDRVFTYFVSRALDASRNPASSPPQQLPLPLRVAGNYSDFARARSRVYDGGRRLRRVFSRPLGDSVSRCFRCKSSPATRSLARAQSFPRGNSNYASRDGNPRIRIRR